MRCYPGQHRNSGALKKRRSEHYAGGARRPGTTLPSLHGGRPDRQFHAEYPAKPGASDNVDTDKADEVIVAIASVITGAQGFLLRCKTETAACIVERIVIEIDGRSGRIKRATMLSAGGYYQQMCSALVGSTHPEYRIDNSHASGG